MYKNRYNEKGFTLIELLIVIVIIGILSGILISVVDPVRQQNRSRNAAIKAAVNKASFAINTARAGMGTLPSDDQLEDELENMTPNDCNNTDELSCAFTLAGTVLPNTCNGDPAYAGANGSSACHFYAHAPDLDSSVFRVIAKKYKLDPGNDDEDESVYVFDSSQGFWECPAGGDYATETMSSDDFANCETVSTGAN